MGDSLYVGREQEIKDLVARIGQARNQQGSTVFLDGPPGIGKSSLVAEAISEAVAQGLCTHENVAIGYCYEQTGETSAYQPLLEIFETLATKNLKPDSGNLLKKIASETAADWLQVIPFVGSTIGATYRTAKLTSELLLKKSAEEQIETMSTQYCNTVARIAQEHDVLVLMVEDAHWIDETSCQLVRRLIPKILSQNVVLVVTYRATHVGENHRLRAAILEAVTRGHANNIQLNVLPRAEVERYTKKRYGPHVPDEFIGWLMHISSGHPMFVEQYLSLLELEKIVSTKDGHFKLAGEISVDGEEWSVQGELAALPVPESVEALVEQRISQLLDDERELLEIGAVQGPKFLSVVLARLLDSREHDVLTRLRRVRDRHNLISVQDGEDWVQNKSELYMFEHVLLHQALYARLTPRQKILYHQEVAEALQQTWHDKGRAPRKLLIDIAHHFEQGLQHESAADFYRIAARSSYKDGAVQEAVNLCHKGLASLQQLSDGDQTSRLTVELSLLLLLAAKGSGDRENRLKRIDVASTAERVAAELEDTIALANLKALHGHLLVGIGETAKAMGHLREAVHIAEQVDDPTTLVFTMLQLGSQLAKENLRESLTVRRQALEVYEKELAPAMKDADSVDVKRYFNLLLVYVGVGEFDSGEFDVAEDYLRKGFDGLLDMQMENDLIQAQNYLSQLLIVEGRFDEAEQILLDGVTKTNKKDLSHPWIACNMALLGKLYLEKRDVGNAQKWLARGEVLSEKLDQEDLVSLVRNQYAEYLIDEAVTPFESDKAFSVLYRSITKSRESGLVRSEVMALSLMSRYQLRIGNVDAALLFGKEAIELVESEGQMPALRQEEILFHYGRVLHAAGKEREATSYFARARAEVIRKSESIHDANRRETFLTGVPINLAIMDKSAG